MFGFDQNALLRIVGYIFAFMGLVVRLGLWKRWYWRGGSATYAYLPLGVLLILLSYTPIAKQQLGTIYFLYWLGLLLSAVCSMWWVIKPPTFIKPRWARWIDKHPDPIRKTMKDEVERGVDWETLIRTEADVDIWAKDLSKKASRQDEGSS
jgi:hypothetical protein